jgi:hypothetical protein
MADDWTIGNLPTEYYGSVEDILKLRLRTFDPILRPEDIDDDNRKFLTWLDRAAENCIDNVRAQFDITQDIRRCFFFTTRLNAYAMRPGLTDGTSIYLVGILGGVAVTLSHSMQVVAKDPALREFLGLSPGEDVSVTERTLDYLELQHIGYRWLIHHELGHVKNGHLHLDLRTAFGGAAFEGMELDQDENRNLTRHTMEMDADSVACGQSFGEIFARPYDNPKLSSLLRNDLHRIRAFAISVFTTLRSFEEHRWSEDLMFRFTHPPAGVRMVLIIVWGVAYFEKYPGKIKPVDWATECITACKLVDAAFGRKVNDDPELQKRVMEGIPGQSGYLKRLLQRWALIRPSLEPFLLGGVLAPAQENPA